MKILDRVRQCRSNILIGTALAFSFIVFAVFIMFQGKNPFLVYRDIIATVITNRYGFCEVILMWTPLLLTAMAAIIPAKAGLSNVGGEGQLIAGALGSTIASIYIFNQTDRIVGIPMVLLSGMAVGGLWGGVAGFFKLRWKMNDTLTTLVMNYVMVNLSCFMIYGPIKDNSGDNYPYSSPIPKELRFRVIENTRLNIGIIIALVIVIFVWFYLNRTKKGILLQMTGKNRRAAILEGIEVKKIQYKAFFMGGALAGLAGAIQICGVEGRLRITTGTNLGYLGFLAAVIAWNHPISAIAVTFLIALLNVSGNAMEISSGLPSATINILMALTLISILIVGRRKRTC